MGEAFDDKGGKNSDRPIHLAAYRAKVNKLALLTIECQFATLAVVHNDC